MASARLRAALAAVAILAGLLAVYAPHFGNGFTYDDHSMIEGNPQLRPDGSWRVLLTQSVYGHFGDRGTTNEYWRPAMYAVYRLAFALGGGTGVGFHVAGFLLHLVCTLLVAVTLRRLGLAAGAALAAATLYAFHPLAAEVVYWPPGIADQELVAATLVALAAATVFHSASGGRRALAGVAIGLATLLGLVAKETALAIAPLLTLEALRGDRHERWRRLGATLPAWLATALYFVLRAAVLRAPALVGERPELLWSLGRSGRALLWYARMLVVPWPLTPVHPFPLGSERTALDLAGAGVVLILIGLGLWLLLRRPEAAFWVGWMALPVAPALFHFFSGMRVASGVVVAERYLYPALVPWLALLVRVLGPRLGRAAPALVAAAALFGGVLVHGYGAAFRDDGAMFRHARRYAPDSAFVLNQLATQELRAGRPGEALPLLERAVAIDGSVVAARLNLGATLLALGRPADAVAAIESALELEPALAGAHALLGDALAAAGREDDAAGRWTRAAELDPGNVAVRASLGNLFWRHDRREAAIAAWQEALAIAPDTPGLLFNLGLAWIETGAPERGRPLLERFLALAPPEAEQQREAAARALGR